MYKLLKISLALILLLGINPLKAQEIKPEYSDITYKTTNTANCYKIGGCITRNYFELEDGTVLYVRSFPGATDYLRIASYDKNLKLIADEKVTVKNRSSFLFIVIKIDGNAYVRYRYEDKSTKKEKLVLRKINPSDISLGEEIVQMQISLADKRKGWKIDEGYSRKYIQVLTSDNLLKIYEVRDGFKVVHTRDIDLSKWDYKDYYLNVYESEEEGVDLNYSLTLFHKGGAKTKMLFYDSDDTNHRTSNIYMSREDILPGYTSGMKVCLSESDNGEDIVGYVTNEETNNPILTGVMIEKDSDEIENTYTHELDLEWVWKNVSGKWKSSYEKSVKKGSVMPLALKMRAVSLNPNMSMTFVLNMNYGKIILINVDEDGSMNWRTVINKFDKLSLALNAGYSPVGLKGYLDIKTKILGEGRILVGYNISNGFKMISVNENGDLSEDMTYVYSKKEEHIVVGVISDGNYSEDTSDYWYFMNIYVNKAKLMRIKIPD